MESSTTIFAHQRVPTPPDALVFTDDILIDNQGWLWHLVNSKAPQTAQLHPLLLASVDEHLPGGSYWPKLMIMIFFQLLAKRLEFNTFEQVCWLRQELFTLSCAAEIYPWNSSINETRSNSHNSCKKKPLNDKMFTCCGIPTSLDALVQFEKLGCDTIYEDKALCSARYDSNDEMMM